MTPTLMQSGQVRDYLPRKSGRKQRHGIQPRRKSVNGPGEILLRYHVQMLADNNARRRSVRLQVAGVHMELRISPVMSPNGSPVIFSLMRVIKLGILTLVRRIEWCAAAPIKATFRMLERHVVFTTLLN